ncbi:transposase [Akkermansiaceae bacterium]|nr:transposase [Akkermansiaceae bacterium]
MNVKSPSVKESQGDREWTPLELAEVKTPRRIGRIWQQRGASSRRRIKPDNGSMCYHVMSRTVNGEFLFGDVEKEAFRRMMWRMASFSGVEVLTYVVMSNHFHILVKVPDREKWLRKFEGSGGEAKLMEHLATVYSKKYLEQLKGEIAQYREQRNERAIAEILERFRKRFCDVSLFVKELKERFSRWLNKQLGRRGTLWMDRFKSVLVDGSEALATMAAYIDLNPVRAGIVEDPSEYEWSGYGEALSGSRRARRGICKALNLPQDSWEPRALSRYRCFLYEEGLVVEETERPSRRGFSKAQMAKVLKEETHANRQPRLSQRIPSFTQGLAIGRRSFVAKFAEKYRESHERQKVKIPKALEIGGKDSEICVLRE